MASMKFRAALLVSDETRQEGKRRRKRREERRQDKRREKRQDEKTREDQRQDQEKVKRDRDESEMKAKMIFVRKNVSEPSNPN